MSGYRLGVDYGTSNTVAVLAWPDGRCRPLYFGASELLPSAVHAGPDGTLSTGTDALRAGRIAPAGLEPNPKRRVDDGEVLLNTTSYPVATLMAATLQTVWSEAVRVADAPPSEVTVTYPAGWGQARRALLSDAAERAGFASPHYVPEPVAAATYFVTQAASRVPVGACAVVYDLGAGTFDVCLVRRTTDGFEVLAAGGLDDVGGRDLDGVVVDRVRVALAEADPVGWRRLASPGDAVEMRAYWTLWTEAREVKEALSRQSMASMFVPLLDREVHVGREEFERGATGMLERTASTMTRVVAEAGVAWSEVAAVFLVGGASRVPMVATVVHRACGIAPTVVEQPELVVAEGSLRAPRNHARPAAVASAPTRLIPPRLARVLDAAAEAGRSLPSDELWTTAFSVIPALVAVDPARAEHFALSLPDEYAKEVALLQMVAELAAVDPGRAEQVVQSFPDGSPHKAEMLYQLMDKIATTMPHSVEGLRSDAERSARAVPDDEGKVSALGVLASMLAEAGDPGRAERLRAEAEQVALSLPLKEARTQALRDLAFNTAAMDPARAERLVLAIPETEERLSQVLVLGEQLAAVDPRRATGLLAEAERLILSRSDLEERATRLKGLVSAWAGVDPARAERLIASFPPESGYWKTLALKELATALAATDPDRAERLAELVPRDEAENIGAVAEGLAAIDPRRAERIAYSIPKDDDYFVLALEGLVEELAPVDPYAAERVATLIPADERGEALVRVVTSMAPVDPGRAEHLARASPSGGLDGTNRSSALVTVARALAETDRRRAEQILAEAERLARTDHGISAAVTLAAVAEVVAVLDLGRAHTLLQEAELLIPKISDEYADYRASSQQDLVSAWASVDLDRAERLARSIPDTHIRYRVEALAALAKHIPFDPKD